MLLAGEKSLVCSSRGLRDGAPRRRRRRPRHYDRRFCAAVAAAWGVSFQRRGRRKTIHQPIMSAASRGGNGAVSALLRSEFPPYLSHHELTPLTPPFNRLPSNLLPLRPPPNSNPIPRPRLLRGSSRHHPRPRNHHPGLTRPPPPHPPLPLPHQSRPHPLAPAAPHARPDPL